MKAVVEGNSAGSLHRAGRVQTTEAGTGSLCWRLEAWHGRQKPGKTLMFTEKCHNVDTLTQRPVKPRLRNT